MAVSLVYMPIMTFRDSNDNPIPFAKVHSFAAGTTTPLALYADPGGATPLSNPAICDASGRLVAYGTIGLAYKLNVLDALNVQVPGWPIDHILVSETGNLTLIDDYASTVAQFRQTRNPGLPGTEALPTNAAQEIEILRYVAGSFGAVSPWYAPTAMVTMRGDTAFYNMDGSGGWQEGVTSAIFAFLRVPPNYAGGVITFEIWRRAAVVGGVAWMPYQVFQTQDGQIDTGLISSQIHLTATDALTHVTAIPITLIAPTSDTMLRVLVLRDGGNAADTNTGSIIYAGHSFTYLGYRLR